MVLLRGPLLHMSPTSRSIYLFIYLFIYFGKAAFGLNQVLKNFRSESERILILDNKEFYYYIEEIPCSDSEPDSD